MTLCTLLATLCPLAAVAGGVAAGSVTPSQSDHHFAGTEDHVRIESVARESGDQDSITVTLVIDPGYHINANPASYKGLIPTTLSFTGLNPSRIIYPMRTSFQPKFANETIDVYQGTVKIIAIFAKGTLTQQTRLRGSVLAQACTDQICLPPAEISIGE